MTVRTVITSYSIHYTKLYELAVIRASEEELVAHRAWLEELDKQSAGRCVWRQLEASQ